MQTCMANRISENFIFFRLPCERLILSSKGVSLYPLVPNPVRRISGSLQTKIGYFYAGRWKKSRKKFALQNLLSFFDAPIQGMLKDPIFPLG